MYTSTICITKLTRAVIKNSCEHSRDVVDLSKQNEREHRRDVVDLLKQNNVKIDAMYSRFLQTNKREDRRNVVVMW